jgi:ketosteroid isomerase-like protein
MTQPDVAQSGDLGYTQGTLSYTMTDPKTGKPINDQGKWLTIRKKQADGSWKIVQDAWNSDVPSPSTSK